MVYPKLIAEGKVEAGIESRAQQVGRKLLVPFEPHPRQAKLALLVVVVRVVVGRLADEKLGHVVVEELVEVVGPDHYHQLRVGMSQRLAIGHDLANPLIGKVGPALRWSGAGAIENG